MMMAGMAMGVVGAMVDGMTSMAMMVLNRGG